MLVARVLEAMLHTGRHQDDVAGLQFHHFIVEIHHATAHHHIEHLVLMLVSMHQQFLSGQKAQQTTAQVFLNKQRHVCERLFVVTCDLLRMKDLSARRHDRVLYFLRRADKIRLPRKIKIASTLNSPAHIRSG